MTLLLLLTPALAWNLEQANFTAGISADAIALLPHSDPARAARYQRRGLDIYDPATGVVMAHTEVPGTAVAWMPDGSGVVGCTGAATVFHAWDGATLGAAVELAPTPCDAVQSRLSDVVVLVDGEAFTTAGATLEPTGLFGELLAARGDDLAVADRGGTTYTVLEGTVETTAAVTGHRVGGLASSDGRWWSQGNGRWRSDDGHAIPGTHATTGDIDGDGLADLIATDPDPGDLWVWASLNEMPRKLHLAMWAYSVAPVDGVACGAVIGPRTVSEGEFYHRSVFCGGDADMDGFTSEEGDCDDADMSRHPDFGEICNDVDHDCDGATYPLPLEVSGVPTMIDEGERFEITTNACGIERVPACRFFPTCFLPDEGTHELRFTYADRPEQERRFIVEVANVPPQFIDLESVVFQSGVENELLVEVHDPGPADVVTLELVDGPDWLELHPDGRLVGTPPRSLGVVVTAHLAASDEDGGRAEAELEIRVAGIDVLPDGCGPDVSFSPSCATGSPALGWWSLWLGVWLVRRRGPAPVEAS